MSGHSKWANIQHRKGRQDAKRSNMWTKIVREIIIAARTGGGGDPDMNPKLRLALVKARGANVPKDTIKNAILKGTGQLEGVSRIISEHGGNVVSVHYDRGDVGMAINACTLHITMETRNGEQAQEICRRLKQAGFDLV